MKNNLINACDRTIEFSLYGFIFFLPISNAIIEVFVGFSIFAYLVKKLLEKKLPRNTLNPYLLVYFLTLLLSAFFSTFISLSFRTIFAKILHYVAFFYVVSEFGSNKIVLKNLLVTLCCSLLLISIDGIQQYFTHFDFIRNRHWMWEVGNAPGRITASFTTPNSLATYLLPSCLIILTLFISLKKSWFSLLALITFMLSFISFTLTLTRSAWLSFIAAIGGMLFLSKGGKKIISIVFFCTVFIILLFIFNDFVRQRFLNLFNLSDISGLDRKLLWQMSINMFKGSPVFGVGIGTFMQNFDKFSLFPTTKQISYAHNSYLQILAESGLLGLSSILLLIVFTFKNSLTAYFKSLKNQPNLILLGFTSAYFAFLVHAFFDNHFYSLTFSLFFWFLTGVVISLSRHDSR